ncbi:hypothetical protein NYE69_04585 [Paenibacillus sp. FSL R5-0527]
MAKVIGESRGNVGFAKDAAEFLTMKRKQRKSVTVNLIIGPFLARRFR